MNLNPYFNPNYFNPNYFDLVNARNKIDEQLKNMQPQAPVQNIINTSKVDLEARYLNENENIADIIISNRTVFIDEKNGLISIKELDGSISKTYNIIIPKDEKDLRIEFLENKLSEMEMKLNGYAELFKPNNEVVKSDTSDIGDVKSTAKRTSK